MYFLGIDAGGTQCRARLCDAKGKIVGRGAAGPANTYVGIGQVFSAIETASRQATAEAKLNARAIATIHAGIGIAGISRSGAMAAMQAQPFVYRSVAIRSDGFIANLGAHGGGDGGVVIVGTGSTAIGRIAGRDIQIGGYGFPVSDEGSGAYMGLQAIRMTLRASDGRIEHTDMTRAVFREYGGRTNAIIGWMDKAAATEYAALAPLVVRSATAGDAHGQMIVREAARHIEMMISGLYGFSVPRCALLGGLAGPLLPWLSPEIRARLVQPQGDALDGALLLARQQVVLG